MAPRAGAAPTAGRRHRTPWVGLQAGHCDDGGLTAEVRPALFPPGSTRELSGTGLKDVAWLRPDGQELTELDWHDPQTHVLGMLIHGQATDEKDDHGRPVIGRTLLLLVNFRGELTLGADSPGVTPPEGRFWAPVLASEEIRLGGTGGWGRLEADGAMQLVGPVAVVLRTG